MVTSFRIVKLDDGLLLRMHRDLVDNTLRFLGKYIVFSKAEMKSDCPLYRTSFSRCQSRSDCRSVCSVGDHPLPISKHLFLGKFVGIDALISERPWTRKPDSNLSLKVR